MRGRDLLFTNGNKKLSFLMTRVGVRVNDRSPRRNPG
jgi:hypothetical protein